LISCKLCTVGTRQNSFVDREVKTDENLVSTTLAIINQAQNQTLASLAINGQNGKVMENTDDVTGCLDKTNNSYNEKGCSIEDDDDVTLNEMSAIETEWESTFKQEE
jgi:hypothetical protein